MSESSWVAIICSLVAIINVLGMAFMTSMNKSLLWKMETICTENTKAHQDMWKRIYGHQHEVKCNSELCKSAKAFNVKTFDMFDFLATCVGGFAGVLVLIVVFNIN